MTDFVGEIDQFLRRLFPICRSITGNGNRKTLSILNEIVPIVQYEVPSGSQVYDWTIPDEWNVSDAWISTPEGRRIVDFQINNLHLMSYSVPIQGRMDWTEIKPHLYIHSELPKAIPYRTSYYKRDWGFCVTHDQYAELERSGGNFEVVIDSELKSGSLTYGEYLLPGRSPQEILISCYICHPSMANDCVSGMLLTAFLAKHLENMENRNWSYRIVFVPETIGAIAYCAANEKVMEQIDMGLVITTVGGPGKIGYKQSWQKNHAINRMIEGVVGEFNKDFITYPFDIHGSDERQYSSLGFRINVATICKDKYYEYPYYHTSLDDLNFVKAEVIHQVLLLYIQLIQKFEQSFDSMGTYSFVEVLSETSDMSPVYRNLFPKCEVMLSKRGLYPSSGGAILPREDSWGELDKILSLLFYCDGKQSLATICRYLNIPLDEILSTAAMLEEKGLMEKVADE